MRWVMITANLSSVLLAIQNNYFYQIPGSQGSLTLFPSRDQSGARDWHCATIEHNMLHFRLCGILCHNIAVYNQHLFEQPKFKKREINPVLL